MKREIIVPFGFLALTSGRHEASLRARTAAIASRDDGNEIDGVPDSDINDVIKMAQRKGPWQRKDEYLYMMGGE